MIEAINSALGQPASIRLINENGIMRYYLRVEPTMLHTFRLGFEFGGETQNGQTSNAVVISVNNVFDTQPSMAAEDEGFLSALPTRAAGSSCCGSTAAYKQRQGG